MAGRSQQSERSQEQELARQEELRRAAEEQRRAEEQRQAEERQRQAEEQRQAEQERLDNQRRNEASMLAVQNQPQQVPEAEDSWLGSLLPGLSILGDGYASALPAANATTGSPQSATTPESKAFNGNPSETQVVAADGTIATVEVKDTLAPDRKAELDAKARALKGQVNSMDPVGSSAKDMAETVRGIRDKDEAEYVLAAYNAMYTKEGDEQLTMDDLLNQVDQEIDGEKGANDMGGRDYRDVIKSRLQGDPKGAAKEAFRVFTNGGADKFEAGSVSQAQAKELLKSVSDLTPKQRAELYAENPRYQEWMEKAAFRQFNEKERRDLQIMNDTTTSRNEAYVQVRGDEVTSRMNALQRERKALNLPEELTAEDRARIEREVDALDPAQFQDRAETLAAKREKVTMEVGDLQNQPSRERMNEILDKAAQDDEYRKIMVEQYAKLRKGEVPLGPDGKPLQGLDLLQNDLNASAQNRTWGDVASDIWADPLSILVKPATELLGSKPVNGALEDDVASVNQRVETLRAQEQTEDVRRRIAQVTGDKNLDSSTLDTMARRYEDDPQVKAALDSMGVTPADLRAARDAQEKAESARRAAEFVKGIKNDDVSSVVDALDDPAGRAARTSLEKRRKELEKGGSPEELAKVEKELTALDEQRARKKALFDTAIKEQTGKDADAFIDGNVKHGRVASIAKDALKKGEVADEDLAYVAAKTGKADRMAAVLRGKTPAEVRQLNRTVHEKYGDADMASGLYVSEQTEDRSSREAGWNRGMGDGTRMLDKMIGDMDVSSNGTRTAMRLMLKGDPKAVYDPDNPPSDAQVARQAAQERLKMERERDATMQKLHREEGGLQTVEDGFEDFFKHKGTGKAADEKYDELEAWRAANEAKLASGEHPELWAEYQRKRDILAGNLKENEAYNNAATDNAVAALKFVGGTAITLASGGTLGPATILMMQTALAIGGVALESVMKDGGLSEAEFQKKLGTVVLEALADATVGTTLAHLKKSDNPLVKKIAEGFDDYGMDVLKANSAKLLVDDAWKRDPKLMAIAKSLGEGGEAFIKKYLTNMTTEGQTNVYAKAATEKLTTRGVDIAKNQQLPTLGDVVKDGVGVLAKQKPEEAQTSPVPR